MTIIKSLEFFKILSHEIRLRIIYLLNENIEMSYTDILHTLNIREGQLNFHLKKMKDFLQLTEKKNYRLSENGNMTYIMVQLLDKRLYRDANKIIKSDGMNEIKFSQLFERLLAATIDFTLFIFPIIIFFLFQGLKLDIHTFLLVIYLQLILQLTYVYFTIMEAYNGQTIGKYIMKIRIVKTNGDKMTMIESAIRNIGKVFFPLDLLIGLLFFRRNGYIKFTDYYTRTKIEKV